MNKIYIGDGKFATVQDNKINGEKLDWSNELHRKVIHILDEEARKKEEMKKKFGDTKPKEIIFSGVITAECPHCGAKKESVDSLDDAQDSLIKNYDSKTKLAACRHCGKPISF